MPWVKKANLSGPAGVPGPPNDLRIGTVMAAETPSASLVGNSPQILNLRLPRGAQGLPGLQAIPADAAVAGYVGTVGTSQTKKALKQYLAGMTVDGTGATGIAIQAAGSKGRGSLISLNDEPTHDGHLLALNHYGNGQSGANSQAYGIDIHNYPGARQPIVIHQYSDHADTASIHIDNTATQPALRVWNTQNQTLNPGFVGTGAFFQLRPWQAPGYFHFTNDLVLENKTQHGLVARVPADGRPVTAFTVDQLQAQVALHVSQKHEDFWAGIFESTGAYGVRIGAASAGAGQALTITRSATAGVGEAVRIVNAGNGDSLAIRDGSRQVAKIAPNGEYENLLTSGGIILRSGNGTRYRITVTNTGTITATAA